MILEAIEMVWEDRFLFERSGGEPSRSFSLLRPRARAKARKPRCSTSMRPRPRSCLTFVKFVEWPPQAFEDANSPLIIGVVGDDNASIVIEQVINGRTANGRRLVVRRFSSFKTLSHCHIVFLRSFERDRAWQTLTAAGSGVLTVGETEGLARYGGIINFTIIDGKLRLEINQSSAEKAGLRISAKLLSLARVIRN